MNQDDDISGIGNSLNNADIAENNPVKIPSVESVGLPFVENIPDELKNLNQWVLWKYSIRTNAKGEKRLTKIPYQANGREAEPNNPETWGSFEAVYGIVADPVKRKGFHGIGFVFAGNDNLVGVDIDHVYDPSTGEWNEFALDEVIKLNSYAELSPSKTGAHVIVKGEKPSEGCRAKNWEMYTVGRYFTFTGNHIPDTPKTINEAQDAIRDLHRRKIEEVQKRGRGRPKKGNVIISGMKSPAMKDADIISKCRKARNYEEFEALYNGTFDNYPSQSEADLSLCKTFAFYTQNPEQIDRLFKSSGLYRDKWDRDEYKNATIQKAIAGNTSTYDPNYGTDTKPKRISIGFDEIGDRVLSDYSIFSMRDNGEIFIYKNGVYRSKGSEAILNTIIRETHIEVYKEKWREENPRKALPERIEKATAKDVSEVMAYIRAYTHVDRGDIDSEQSGYINFKNGMFDLKEWKLKPHTPEIRSIAQIPAKYDPDAKCTKISHYMRTCELSEDVQTVLFEFSGYCLIPDVSLQRAMMLYGSGSNGKSVFINLLKIVLGEDFVSGESLHNLETDKYRVAKLYGKRLNAFPDLKDTPLQTNEVFNTLTGGDLDLIGERKYQHSFSFKPTTKLLFSANKPPYAHSDNYAYYRRWILIKFPKTFEKKEIDEDLINKLTTEEEISGFINLILEGLKRLLENRKFSYDVGVDEIERIYLMNSDNVRIFEEECLRDCSGNEEATDKKLVYAFYCTWCKNMEITPIKGNAFTTRLGKLGRRVHDTTKYNVTTKKGEHHSTYFNTVVDFQQRLKTE